MNYRRISPIRLLILIGLIALIAVVGTVGFMVLEGEDPMAAFLVTVNLLSTVGMGQMPATFGGQVLAVVLIATGVGTLLYVFTTLIDFLIGGYFAEILGERSMKKRIAELKGHYIICGFGRVGEQVAQEFSNLGGEFIVIDSDPASIAHSREHGYLSMHGDASDDDVLRSAGVTDAAGLVACVDSDAENVFVTLTARGLCSELQIVARANSEESRNKLEKAGADKVVSPYSIGGKEMANLMMKPMVSDYLDLVTGGGELEIRIESFRLQTNSPAIGQTLESLQVRQRTGTSVLAVRKPGGEFDTNPEPSISFEEKDILICAGTREEMKELERLLAPAVAAS